MLFLSFEKKMTFGCPGYKVWVILYYYIDIKCARMLGKNSGRCVASLIEGRQIGQHWFQDVDFSD